MSKVTLNSKLTEDQMAEIGERHAWGDSLFKLAGEYEVTVKHLQELLEKQPLQNYFASALTRKQVCGIRSKYAKT